MQPKTFRLAQIIGALMLCSLSMPSTSLGVEEPPPQITSFTATPSTLKVGETTLVSAQWDKKNSSYDIAILNADTGAVVARCWSVYPPCNTKIKIPWSENRSPKDLHLAAQVVRSGVAATASGSGLTVHVERVEWTVPFTASKNPLSVGEKTTLRVGPLSPSPSSTGYYTKIINDDTGKVIAACAGSECTGVFEYPYSMQAEAGPVHVHAEVVTEAAPYDVAGRSDITLYVDPIPFRVSMTFSEPKSSSNGDRTWLTTATPSPLIYSSPFTTWIYRSDGSAVAGCIIRSSCAGRIGPGTYRAVVKDSENIYAATGWWTIAPGPTGEPQEESADDFNLVALAALFTGPTQVCSTLLFYPGTHLQGSSLSDQYLACEEAVAAGGSTTAVLRAVAGAAGGTAVLWYLYEQKTKEQTPTEGTEPAEETEPPPAPPIGWPGEVTTEAELLRQLNPQLQSDREARIVVKQCHRLTIRAALPTADCTAMPIFASGDLDVPQATKHDLEALLYYPGWVKLNYEGSGKSGAGWYSSYPVCEENSLTLHCDEFPFFSTQQGGGSAKPRPSLKLIDGKQNIRQGSKLGRFYAACGVNVGIGKPFLNVPMPQGSNVPTLILCNGNS